jgi:hypothetical protein
VEVLEGRQLLSAIPAASKLVGPEDFVLKQDGTLERIFRISTNFVSQTIDSGVGSISVGLDNFNGGMVAYVKSDGTAHEWSDTNGAVPLSDPALGITNNVGSVAASIGGGAFVLRNDSELLFFKGPTSNQWLNLSGNIRSVSAGTDASGSPSCDVTAWGGTAWTWSLSGVNAQLTNPSLGITNNVSSVAAGPLGAVFVLRNDSELFLYHTDSNKWQDLSGNIRSVSAISDPNASKASCDVTCWDGTAWVSSSDPSQNMQLKSLSDGISNNIRSASLGADGISDVVLNDGTLWQYDSKSNMWTMLDTGVA